MGEVGPLVARGRTPTGRNREGQSTDARHRGGPARTSDEGSVMELERRGRAGQERSSVNPTGEEPVSEPKSKVKSFEIPKRLIYQAWKKVRTNAGAPGVDAVSITEFERNERDNLYKLWNRMSAGSYMPGPVRAVEIPKDQGAGVRTLGVPNVADRVAQTAAAMLLEERLEPIFHPDSYGYRPGRNAHDALATTRKRCWNKDWVIDLDIRAFFDSVPWDLMAKAVAHHTDERWVLLYIDRWLRAPMQMADGTLREREKGTPQGSRSHRCWPTSSCTTRSTCGWSGSIRAAHSSALLTTRSSTAQPSVRPEICWLTSPSGSGPLDWSCTPTRRRSCTARTRTVEPRRSTPASTSSATPFGAGRPKASMATS